MSSEDEADLNSDVGEDEPNEHDFETKHLDKNVRKVFIAHNSIGKDDWNFISTISLPHPKTKVKALFLIDSRAAETNAETRNQFIFETLTMTHEEGISSWFVGNFVSSDGNLYIFTPFDPIFLILPALMQSNQAKPFLDHLIEYFPLKFAKTVTRQVSSKQLQNIAVQKVSGDIEAYLYDEERTLSWLSKKVQIVAKHFEEKKLTRSEASVSSNFTKSIVTGEKSTEEYLRYACDLVCEYLDDSLKGKLQANLKLPVEPDRQKRKNIPCETEEDSKRLKLDMDNIKPLEDYGTASSGAKSNTKGPSSTKQKQLQQAAKGTHSLLKFFTAKPK